MKRAKPRQPIDPREGTYGVGGHVDSYTITLRVVGDELDPDEITGAMKVPPDRQQRKGDLIRSADGKHLRAAKAGCWHLSYQPSADEDWDLESGIETLLSRLPSDLSVWSALAQSFEMDLFSGLFLSAPDQELSLSASVLRKLSDRHIEPGLDIDSPDFDTAIESFLKRG